MATISINLIVPQGWHELDDAQLRYVYSLIAKEFSADEIKTLALLHFSGCKVIARHDKNSFLLKHGKDVFQTSGTLIAEVIPSLGWLDAIPASPVRLKKLRNHASVDAEFQGVPFETYIVVENLYQGFLSTQNDALLDDLAHVLYPGCSASLTPEERISIFYWVASLKDMFARRFPDFFQPATANAENLLGSSPLNRFSMSVVTFGNSEPVRVRRGRETVALQSPLLMPRPPFRRSSATLRLCYDCKLPVAP